MEENILLSEDGSEVLFRIVQDRDGTNHIQYISIDLQWNLIKLWSKNFEDVVLSNFNPHSYFQLK